MAIFRLHDPEKTQSSSAKLQRPWFVLTLGVLVPVGAVAFVAVTSADSRVLGVNQMFLLGGFAAVCVLLASLYVFLGTRYSVAVARRVVGTIGSILGLGGVALLVGLLYKYAI